MAESWELILDRDCLDFREGGRVFHELPWRVRLWTSPKLIYTRLFPFYHFFPRLLRFRDFLNSLKILWWGGHAHSKVEMEFGRAMGIEPTSFTFFVVWKRSALAGRASHELLDRLERFAFIKKKLAKSCLTASILWLSSMKFGRSSISYLW